MSRLLSTYLLSLRKRSGLSQSELAMLLGIDGSALCKFENLSRRPTIELAVGAEVIFGHPMKGVFPAFYDEIERVVVERARRWRDRYKARPKPATGAKLRILDEIIARASQPTLGL
jgi:transcriptional regulator with XRE-family HTH domain